MKKKMVILLLTLGILGMAAGCGDKKADTDKKEETAEEFVLTNDDGKVVAVDVENLEDYITLGEYKNSDRGGESQDRNLGRRCGFQHSLYAAEPV